jgi:hypothetical protein
MLAKLSASTAGKVTIAAIAAVAVCFAVFMGIRATSGEKPANPEAVKAAAQTQIDVINKENLPPALKAEMLARQQGLAKGGQPGTPPPSQPHPNGSAGQ